MVTSPFTVELFNKGFTRTGFANDHLGVSMTVRHNRPSTATLTLGAAHVRAAAMLTPGSRVVLTYTPDGATPTVLSGVVTARTAAGPVSAGDARVDFGISGDWRVLGAHSWPVPGNAVTAQSADTYTATGPAETVIKNLIRANVTTRLGRPVTVTASSGRGSTVTVKTRFEKLDAVVAVLADQGGIGVSVVQSGAGFVVDCYVPTDRTNITLSEANHTISDWSWTSTAPAVTRVVVGGKGEGALRPLVARVDAASEAAWGDVQEDFVDAGDADTTAELQAAGDKALADGAATSGFAVTLAESAAMTYGRNVRVGDRITVEPLPGYPVQDVLREVTIAWSLDQGQTVEPVFGDPDQADPQRVAASAIARLADAIKKLRAR